MRKTLVHLNTVSLLHHAHKEGLTLLSSTSTVELLGEQTVQKKNEMHLSSDVGNIPMYIHDTNSMIFKDISIAHYKE